MIIHKATKDLLKFLQAHPEVRSRIRADSNQTVLYSGKFFKDMWKEIRAIQLWQASRLLSLC